MTQPIETSLFATILFWVIATTSVVAAIAVVQVRDIFKAALFLVLSFLGVAGLFVLLRAEFLAVVQVLIYVGAISILIIFAILLTRDVQQGNPSNRLRLPALGLSGLLLAAIAFVAARTDWSLLDNATLSPATSEKVSAVYANTIPWIAQLLLQDFVLPFEAASVLLLAAIIGALVISRER
ncbi:MAG: NADH-quinone oxidoreductase subunit J [Chloroflexi bacterium]|nr:NADH-quinone oxidoreductase subunit J [Chloroflexota bacterium]